MVQKITFGTSNKKELIFNDLKLSSLLKYFYL